MCIPRRISQLWRRAPNQPDYTRRVDHTPLLLPKLPHTHHRILAPPPHALDIDAHSEIPDLLLRGDGVGVVGVHDPCVVEHDVDAAPGVEVGDCGCDVGFLGYVAEKGFELLGGGEGGKDGVDFFKGGGKKRLGDISHEDGGAFAGEEDGRFEADAAAVGEMIRGSKLTMKNED